MSVWQLILKEIRHRKLHFTVGLFSVLVASACLVGALTLLTAHDVRTDQIIAEKEEAVRKEAAALANSYRVIMKKLGHNAMVLHKDQDYAELQLKGYPTYYFPDAYADKLAKSDIKSLAHLLPILQERVVWPEQRREIMLAGIRGQVPQGRRNDKEPITTPVPPGKADLGEDIGKSFGLKPGHNFLLFGEELTVNQVFRTRGNQDDNTIWINLDVAQRLLNRQGQVNGILALECVCNTESLGQITKEVTAILPDTQVIEFGSLVRVRAEARQRAAEAGATAIEAEKANRLAMRTEREQLASVLVPLVLAGCAIWIMLLTYGNVRERRSEIGILRAIGVPARRILFAFVGKAMLMGIIGALVGYAAGLFAGVSLGGVSLATAPARLLSPHLFVGVLLLAPILTGLASWPPAMLAAEQDPTTVLREE